MTQLKRPLSSYLDDGVDEAALARVWVRVHTPQRRAWGSLLLGMGLGAAAGAMVAGLVFGRPAEVPSRGRPLVSAPAAEAALGPVEAAQTPTPHTLGDGSHLRLEPGARIEPLVVSERRVWLHHVRGRVLYDVVPRPNRSFVIDAGAVSVEVTGTRFVVDRGADGMRVEVYEGAVVVRGQGVPDGVSMVAAGEAIVVPLAEATEVPLAATEAALPAPSLPAPRSSAPRLTNEDWLARADRARSEGRPGDAVEPLERVAGRGGRSGALAHHTLGRLWMDELGRPDRAAEAFARALDGDLPASLVERALYRRFLCLRDREAGAARAAAEDYIRSRPRGPHAEELRQWQESP